MNFSISLQQAVQEKFRQAGENIDNLNKWLDQVEREIARQENLSEDADSLKNQINAMNHIKSDVDDHNRPVNNTLDIIIELVETGADVLSASELNQLQAEGKRLKERYDFVQDNSDKLLKRMQSAMEELGKFRSEIGTFRTWMEKAYKVLEDKERQLANLNKLQGNADGIKEFVGDVMTHGADLKFLTISGQKYVSLSKEYVQCLNEFRSKVRSSALKQSESQISGEVGQVGKAYQELLDRANRLADKFSRVGNKFLDYNDAVERAKKWLGATEPKVSKLVSEPIGAEPKVVEDQLNRARALNNEIIANGKLIDDAKNAAANLLNSLDDSQISPQERRQIEQTPKELQDRYDALKVAMNGLCGDLETALGQSQGVQAALANIADWLDKADDAFKNINKPASLIRDRLDEQIRQLKTLQADVSSHEAAIQKMNLSAQEFVQSSKNVRESKKIETKVKEVQAKYQGLVKAVQARGVFLDEISIGLGLFTQQVESFDDWYMEMIEILESREMLTMDADECAKKVDEIARAKDKKKPEYEEMLKLGKALVGKKDVTDSGPCKETIKELEEKWRELGDILGERQNQNRARKQSLNAYEALREQVNTWLAKMERRLESFDPVAVEQDTLNKQAADLKPLIQEHTQYSKTIDKLNEIGMQYDAMLRGGLENGAQRRTSMSPRKPSMTPSGLGSRRSSAAPGKFSSMSSQASPRRESQAPMFQAESPIQAQLGEINNRYDMIGMRLGERDRDVNNMKEEIKVHLDNMKQILAFLEKQEKNLPKEGVPADKKEADKQLRQIKQVLDQLYENQPLLDETKVGIRDLLKRNPNAPGSEHLDHALSQVVGRWKELQDKCKSRIQLLDELKDFHDINDSLNNWLNSKARMMNVLGPIASDPRLVQNQMSQIAVMREDFNEKSPTRDRFNEIGDFLLENTNDSEGTLTISILTPSFSRFFFSQRQNFMFLSSK